MSLKDQLTRRQRQAAEPEPVEAVPDIHDRPTRGRHRAEHVPHPSFLATRLIATKKGHAR